VKEYERGKDEEAIEVKVGHKFTSGSGIDGTNEEHDCDDGSSEH
jgi:hypothetical protein